MIKEIGGYLEYESYSGMEYHENALGVNSGRNALLYLLRALDIKRLWIPYYICDSVIAVCENEGVQISYYQIDAELKPILPYEASMECLLIVNYFGQLTNEDIGNAKRRSNIVIVDNTQAFFARPVENCYSFYNCRKFFGVPDGAYLYTDRLLRVELPIAYSHQNLAYLAGRFEVDGKSFYDGFRNNEKRISAEPLRLMSQLTHNLLKVIDYEKVKTTREDNFQYLHERLGGINRLKLKVPMGPYMYPLYCENGSLLRKHLIDLRIYVPVFWPEVLRGMSSNKFEYDLANNLLPLPVDQRYGITDMRQIVDVMMTGVERN